MVMAYGGGGQDVEYPDQVQMPAEDTSVDFLMPQTDEPLLQGDPRNFVWGRDNWQGPGGGQKAAEMVAWTDFYKQFGRNPTQSELNMLSSAYLSGDPNLLNSGTGKSALTQYYMSLSNTPANYYKRQQATWAKEAPKQYDNVNSVFKSLYGRDATKDEMSHYSNLLASGQADTYQLSQFLQTLPEYTNKTDEDFRKSLSGELESSDQSFFNRAKEDVISRYARMGRTTSPALDVALTDLQAKLNENRGQFMAQLAASQYGKNKDVAINSFGKTQDDVMGRINQNADYQYKGYQDLLKRTQDIQDYDTQARNFSRNMDQYGPQGPNALDYLNTAFNGVRAGAQAYGAF